MVVVVGPLNIVRQVAITGSELLLWLEVAGQPAEGTQALLQH